MLARSILAAGVLGAAVAACARPELTEGAREVKRVDEPLSESCERLGPVRGQSGGAGGVYVADEDLTRFALNDTMNRAAEMGATHVHVKDARLEELDGVTHRGVVEGIAYRCGESPTTATEAAESRVRAALDARAADILACAGTDRLGVRVRLTPGRAPAVGLTGELIDSAVERCVVEVLSDLEVETGQAEGELVHVVRAPEGEGSGGAHGGSGSDGGGDGNGNGNGNGDGARGEARPGRSGP